MDVLLPVQWKFSDKLRSAVIAAENFQARAVPSEPLGKAAQAVTVRICAPYAIVGHLHPQPASLGRRAEPDPGGAGMLQRIGQSF